MKENTILSRSCSLSLMEYPADPTCMYACVRIERKKKKRNEKKRRKQKKMEKKVESVPKTISMFFRRPVPM